ncbi:Fibrinogen-like protein 1,Fibrinogen-like protein A,Angiopoietin-4,Angiopoietin-related protein 6,Techylectin-5B,Angiopoietin-related protein 7,Ficolin-1-A,Angiopoietin-related protein 1,Ficolin-1-B,Ficolin-2,Ficolin-3,Ficolin-1,Fibrinogen C domain-containing protein 1 [Mytilus coruscus]|uniref:Fibrinogen C-terminal domain-containing protein n=1 Tax=Mytilus coruscus TaxID=42192 RepID=A0A6J8BLK7_MYTCO|nr:Fibrinogen-like protein 1,Fibrinogen-like protein A,Angiopoietin-4,Angiopoietin-related protein 6,Techylectin-5B,Angiopoietin-related protein 7,Ficolin-1-A,Angiopoietin-related protein 1,Ficolin-1-B,Ficolin-2,Ficolin-3,Ficolin-1,Fibrinogen C domain-containing protein 1 [Mytilus coruscus]
MFHGCTLVLISIFLNGYASADSFENDNCSSSIDIPLISKLNAPLKAELDITSLTKELWELIRMVVKEAVSKEMNDLVENVLDNRMQTAMDSFGKSFNLTLSTFKQKIEDGTAQIEKSVAALFNKTVSFERKLTELVESEVESFTEKAKGIQMKDCNDANRTMHKSGVYHIYPSGAPGYKVYCDMDTDVGGWTVFQYRSGGLVSFHTKLWEDYNNGFGEVSGEHWLGNYRVHQLTGSGNNVLIIYLEDWQGNSRYAVFSNFSVADEVSNYTLSYSTYSGNAGNSLANNMKFTTADRQNDNRKKGSNCALDHYEGPWWYPGDCDYSDLNGEYVNSGKDLPIPKPHIYLQRKSKLRKVFYTQIDETVDQTNLGQVLEEKLDVSPPEAIIAITGISHQFNIKDKRNLKKGLIEAVKSTGSWVVTCGTESGVVQFIEDAVNDHVTLTEIYIPIVGILSKRVLDEIEPLGRVLKVKESTGGKIIRIPTHSTKETLDPNHTQFVFLGDPSIQRPRGCASSESRNAYQRFLSNIKDADFKTKNNEDEHRITKHNTHSKHTRCETNEILPVVLVLIEGGIDSLETALSVLTNNNHVVIIDGSGGAANFLSICYQKATSFKRKSNDEPAKVSDACENIREVVEECFDDLLLAEEAIKLADDCLKKYKLIKICSLKDKTAKVDEIIQDAIFNTYKEYCATEVKQRRKSKINSLKNQLRLVQKWKRCDIAEKHIFITKYRNEIQWLQKLNVNRMYRLKENIKAVTKPVQEMYRHKFKDLPHTYNKLKKNVGSIELLSTAIKELESHVEFMPLVAVEKSRQELKVIRKECDDIELLSREIKELESQVEFMLLVAVEKSRQELKAIRKKCDDLQTLKIQRMDKLKENIKRKMEEFYNNYAIITKNLAASYEKCINSVLQFIEVNKANYFIDKNKAKYFTDVSTSITELMKSMEFRFRTKEQDQFRWIIQEFVDEYEKDKVSELFQSMLIANRKDFVILIMDKIEHMSAFVLAYLPNVFRLCFESEDDSAIKLIDQLKEKKERQNNRILLAVNNFIIDLFEDTEFKLYDVKEGEAIDLIYKDKPFHHLFVWAILVNSREMAMIFWELETDHTCSALFASAVLNELSERAEFSKHMHLSASLKDNARHFETLACNVMSELYSNDRENALKTLVTKVGRYNSTPLKIAVSQKLKKFMAHTACQAQLNSIWSGDIAIAYMAFVVIFAFFVLTDLYPLSENPPSTLEYLTWVWTLSLAIEEIRQLGDLGFFIALYVLFLLSFGIMYQAILFPNSVSSPWELLKDLVYLPYWQLYGELNLEQIEGSEPSKCTNDPQLYTNGTMDRCAKTNQFNALMPAVYLILTNILLVNIIIAIFSQTFQTVQDNSEMIYKFHRYALVYEYHDRPMFPLPIVIHLWRIVVFCYNKLRTTKKYGGAFVYDATPEEIERLNVVERIAYETFQNGPDFARSRYDAMNMMTDERDINKEIDSTPTQNDIKELREDMQRMRESLIEEIRNQEYRQQVFVLDNRRQ